MHIFVCSKLDMSSPYTDRIQHMVSSCR